MIVLGVDPGAKTGLVVLDCSGVRPDVKQRVAADGDDLAGAVRLLCGWFSPDVLAIELPSQVFAHGRGAKSMGARVGIERSLLAARDVAGVIKGIVGTLCPAVRVFEEQAHNVRRAVLGRIPRAPKGTDARVWIDGIVRRRVPLLVTGWKTGAGDNDHNRDAAVAALWGEKRSRLPAALVAPKKRAPRARRA